MREIVHIAHGHKNGPRACFETSGFNLRLQVEIELLKAMFPQVMLTPVDMLGNSENDKQHDRKNETVYCGHSFGEEVDNGCDTQQPVSYTHLRAHETGRNLVCRL